MVMGKTRRNSKSKKARAQRGGLVLKMTQNMLKNMRDPSAKGDAKKNCMACAAYNLGCAKCDVSYGILRELFDVTRSPSHPDPGRGWTQGVFPEDINLALTRFEDVIALEHPDWIVAGTDPGARGHFEMAGPGASVAHRRTGTKVEWTRKSVEDLFDEIPPGHIIYGSAIAVGGQGHALLFAKGVGDPPSLNIIDTQTASGGIIQGRAPATEPLVDYLNMAASTGIINLWVGGLVVDFTKIPASGSESDVWHREHGSSPPIPLLRTVSTYDEPHPAGRQDPLRQFLQENQLGGWFDVLVDNSTLYWFTTLDELLEIPSLIERKVMDPSALIAILEQNEELEEFSPEERKTIVRRALKGLITAINEENMRRGHGSTRLLPPVVAGAGAARGEFSHRPTSPSPVEVLFSGVPVKEGDRLRIVADDTPHISQVENVNSRSRLATGAVEHGSIKFDDGVVAEINLAESPEWKVFGGPFGIGDKVSVQSVENLSTPPLPELPVSPAAAGTLPSPPGPRASAPSKAPTMEELQERFRSLEQYTPAPSEGGKKPRKATGRKSRKGRKKSSKR